MRRRWLVLVAAGAVALVAGIFFLLPPRDDGLDWMRRYGASETKRTWVEDRSIPKLSVTTHLFQFDGPVPDEVQRRVRLYASSRQGNHSHLDQQFVALDPIKKQVYFLQARGSWLEYQWFWLKRRLGIGRGRQQARLHLADRAQLAGRLR